MRSLTLSFLLLGVAATAFAYAPPSPCGPCGTAAPCDAYSVAALTLYGTTTSDNGCGVWYKTGACSSLGLEDMVPFVGCVGVGSPGKRDVEQSNCIPPSTANGHSVEAVQSHWCQDANGQPICKVQQSAEVTVPESLWQSKKRDEEGAMKSVMMVQASKAGFFAHHNCRDRMRDNSCVFQGAGCQATDYAFALHVCETTLGAGFEPRSAAFDGTNIRLFCLKEQEAAGCCGQNPFPYGREFASNILGLHGKPISNVAVVKSDAVEAANEYYGSESPLDDLCEAMEEKECSLETIPAQHGQMPKLSGAKFLGSDSTAMSLTPRALQQLTPSGCSLKDANGPAAKWSNCFMKMRSNVEAAVGKLTPAMPPKQVIALSKYLDQQLGGVAAFDPSTSLMFSTGRYEVYKATPIRYSAADGDYKADYMYNSTYGKG